MKQIYLTILLLIFGANISVNAQCTVSQVGTAGFLTTPNYQAMAVAPSGDIYIVLGNGNSGKVELWKGTTAGTWTTQATLSFPCNETPAIAISNAGKVSILLRNISNLKASLYYLSGSTLVLQGSTFSADTASNFSLAFDVAGNEYAGFTDAGLSRKNIVKKWNSTTSTWDNVGAGAISSGGASYNSLIVDRSNNVIIAYQDLANSQKVEVKKYNGSTWSSIGTFGSSAVTNCKLKLGKNSDNYFLGYTEGTNAIVQKYNGSSWSQLGTSLIGRSSIQGYFDLAVDPNDIPLFISTPSTPPYADIYKYNSSTNTWDNLISAATGTVYVSYVNIDINKDGYPYFYYYNYSTTKGSVRTAKGTASITIQPTSKAICAGSSDSFICTTSGGGSPTFQWQVASPTFYTNATSPYTNTTNSSMNVTALTSLNQNQIRCIVNDGCLNLASNTVTLTVPSSVVITTIPTNPTCNGSCDGMITSSVSGGVGPFSYLWMPANVTTQNITSACAGIYTLTVTDSYGCLQSVISTLNNPPVLSVNTSGASAICNGSSTTLTSTVSGGVSPYTYNWSPSVSLNNPTLATVVASPSLSTTYNLSVIDAGGCAKTSSTTVTVLPSPTITFTGNLNICKGSSTSIIATGANTYSWSTGATTTSISVSPTVTTNYSVTGTNSMGCMATNTVNVSIISNKAINGVVTNTAGATGGDVTLYQYKPYLSMWDSLTSVPLTSSYSFLNKDSGLYIIRAIPTATNIQITYADSSISWQNATIINHGCANNTTQNIKLISLENFVVGPGVLSGMVTEGVGFGQRMANDEFKPYAPGQPIGGIIVKGGRNPGGQMMVQTTTASDGTYTLTGLPLSNTANNEEYFIYVDIPGLDTSATYHKIIVAGNTTISNLNFTVDSMYINPNNLTAGLNNNLSLLKNNLKLYPNPAKNKVIVEYELNENSSAVVCQVLDVLGNKLNIDQTIETLPNKTTKHCFNTEQLSNGVYFIRIGNNQSENTIKFIINR